MTVTNLMEFQRNLSAFLEKASQGADVIGVDWNGGDVVVMSGEAYRDLMGSIQSPAITDETNAADS